MVRWWTCDREVVGSNPARGCCVPMPTQRAIPPGSVNEYQRKLGSKRAYHAMHWPRNRGLAAPAGVRLRAKETEIIAALWALKLGKGLYFTQVISRPMIPSKFARIPRQTRKRQSFMFYSCPVYQCTFYVHSSCFFKKFFYYFYSILCF